MVTPNNFDTFFDFKKKLANLRIRILENTDYRPFVIDKDKKKADKQNLSKPDEIEESDEAEKLDEIDKTVAYFKINGGLDIVRFYDAKFKPPLFDGPKEQKANINEEWSLDISNIQKCQ